jgi:Predicted nucleoside-diphosphate sugar epimerases
MSSPKVDRSAVALSLSLFLALPFALVLLSIRYGPSLSELPLPGAWSSSTILIALAGTALFTGLYFAVFRAGSPGAFAALLAIFTASLVAGAIVLGGTLHRDFFTAAFQFLIGAAIALLFRVYARSEPGKRLERDVAIGKGGVILAAFYAEWVMLMGYAIATRAEPRPVEALVYNVYNLGQILAMLYLARNIDRRTHHLLMLSEQAILVDGRDIVPVIGRSQAEMLRAFARAPGTVLTCPEIQSILRAGEGQTPSEDSGCAACAESGTKAALCAKYRSTYNNLLELKRLLEFLEIGDIVAPANRRKVLSEGWRFSLFEGARIEHRTNKERRLRGPTLNRDD